MAGFLHYQDFGLRSARGWREPRGRRDKVLLLPLEGAVRVNRVLGFRASRGVRTQNLILAHWIWPVCLGVLKSSLVTESDRALEVVVELPKVVNWKLLVGGASPFMGGLRCSLGLRNGSCDEDSCDIVCGSWD